MRPATFSATAGRASIVAAVVSSARPPWFETLRPATPSATARSASRGSMMPFTTMGIRRKERSHAMSFHERLVSEPVRISPGVAIGSNGGRISELRTPGAAPSTVTIRTLHPAASARCALSRVAPRSVVT